MALEGPEAVEHIVAHHGKPKSGAVGKILIEPQFFFEQPSGTKINCRTERAHHTEFQEFDKNLLHEYGTKIGRRR